MDTFVKNKPLRHPEKAKNRKNPILKKPNWIRVKAPTSLGYVETAKLMRDKGLHTVCEEAACPNIGECWSSKHATVMILGNICTRACAFCNVTTGKPGYVDTFEPKNLADSVSQMDMKHLVITSVNRDDLADGGADQFVKCIDSIRRTSPGTTIEVLVPDFRKKPGALEAVVSAKPDVLNHNLETVPRLYSSIRPGAQYKHSLELLARVKKIAPDMFTKSGIMVGLGETNEEVLCVMDDLIKSDVDFLTIGQYLAPSRRHAAVKRFVTPEEFKTFKRAGDNLGFVLTAASPLTRSSYHADKDFEVLKRTRHSH